jgi:hypothetical protein
VCEQHLARAVAQSDCKRAHFSEAARDFIGQRMLGMAQACDLGHMRGQRPHAIDVGDHLDGADDYPQIAGDRLLQGQQHEATVLGTLAGRHNLLMVTDHLLGEGKVGPQQRLGGPLHRHPGKAAHFSHLLVQSRKLVMK